MSKFYLWFFSAVILFFADCSYRKRSRHRHVISEGTVRNLQENF